MDSQKLEAVLLATLAQSGPLGLDALGRRLEAAGHDLDGLPAALCTLIRRGRLIHTHEGYRVLPGATVEPTTAACALPGMGSIIPRGGL